MVTQNQPPFQYESEISPSGLTGFAGFTPIWPKGIALTLGRKVHSTPLMIGYLGVTTALFPAPRNEYRDYN